MPSQDSRQGAADVTPEQLHQDVLWYAQARKAHAIQKEYGWYARCLGVQESHGGPMEWEVVNVAGVPIIPSSQPRAWPDPNMALIETAKWYKENHKTPEPTKVFHLFNHGWYRLSSGKHSTFKIDCDALTDADWDCLAMMALPILPYVSEIQSIPRGGDKFAQALRNYHQELSHQDRRILLVDDVLTTGRSMKQAQERIAFRQDAPQVVGVVAFCRASTTLHWITPLFTLHPAAVAR